MASLPVLDRGGVGRGTDLSCTDEEQKERLVVGEEEEDEE